MHHLNSLSFRNIQLPIRDSIKQWLMTKALTSSAKRKRWKAISPIVIEKVLCPQPPSALYMSHAGCSVQKILPVHHEITSHHAWAVINQCNQCASVNLAKVRRISNLGIHTIWISAENSGQDTVTHFDDLVIKVCKKQFHGSQHRRKKMTRLSEHHCKE